MVPEEGLSDDEGIEIGAFRPGDEVAILRCFERVFDRERSLENWRWAYERNPAGRHVFVARRADGEVIAQFAGLPRRIAVGGEERCFAEIVDSMTDPRYRRGLKRPGWFARTCMAYVDHYGKPSEESVMYGLPLPGALRIGRALLGYVPLYPLELCSGELDEVEARAPLEETGFEAQLSDDLPDDLEGLEARVRATLPIATVRTPDYLRWRYVLAEGRHYEILVLRDRAGALQGVVFLGLEGPVARILDLMALPSEPAFEALVGATEDWARQRGAAVLQGHFAPASAERAALEDLGYELETSPWHLVARTYDFERLPIERLREEWRPSLGDFDVM